MDLSSYPFFLQETCPIGGFRQAAPPGAAARAPAGRTLAAFEEIKALAEGAVAGMEGIKDGRMSVFEDGKLVLPPMAAAAGTPPAFAEPRTACAGMSPRNLLITAAHLRLAVEGSTVKQVTVALPRRCPDTCVRRPLRATRGTGRGPLKRARRPSAPIKANLPTLVTDSGACYTLRTAPSGAASHNCAQRGASG